MDCERRNFLDVLSLPFAKVNNIFFSHNLTYNSYDQILQNKHVDGKVLQTIKKKEDWRELGVVKFGDLRILANTPIPDHSVDNNLFNTTTNNILINVRNILIEERLGAGSYDIFKIVISCFLLSMFKGEVCKGKWSNNDIAIKKLFFQMNEVYHIIFVI